MAYSLQDTTDLTALGNAIRAKTGGSANMTVAEMATAVGNISTGSGGGSQSSVPFGLQIDNYTDNGINNTVGGLHEYFITELTLTGDRLIPINNYLTTDNYLDNGYFYASSSMFTFVNTVHITGNPISIPDSFCRGFSSLASINIPSSVEIIGNNAFYGNGSLSSVTLPSNLEAIGNQAFYNTSLATITIPASVEYIGPRAFEGNYYLTTIYFLGTPTTLGNTNVNQQVFRNCNALTDMYVPWTSGTFSTFEGYISNTIGATIHYEWQPS